MPAYGRTSDQDVVGVYGSNGQVIPNHFWAEDERRIRWEKGTFLGTSTDAGMTPTSILRAGLLIAKIFGDTGSTLFVPWSPTAVDGSQVIRGVLKETVDLKKFNSTGTKLSLQYLAAGPVRADRLIVPGAASMSIVGSAWEYLIMHQMSQQGFSFQSTDWQGRPHNLDYAPIQLDYATATTLTEVQSGALITNLGASGSVAITLPTPKRGLAFRFMTLAAQDLVITAPTADTLIVASDVAADSATLTLAEIGAVAEAFVVRTAADTYKWVVKGQIAADSGITIQT